MAEIHFGLPLEPSGKNRGSSISCCVWWAGEGVPGPYANGYV